MASTQNMFNFKANIGSGLVRPNQFRCTVQIPEYIRNSANVSTQTTFMCRAASLPGSTVAPIPVYYRGRAFNVAGERQFQPWTVTIYNEDFNIRNALVAWSNAINNIGNNSGLIQPAKYQRSILVDQLDRGTINGPNPHGSNPDGNILKQIRMVHAFPVDISPIELDWENNAQVEMFQCTFVYDWYHDLDVNPDGADAGPARQ